MAFEQPQGAHMSSGNSRPYRAILLSSLGGALEFYDFIIFGTFAAYLSRAFFPSQTPTMSLLLTFAVFGAGYLARPVGGMLFGIRGDRSGRRETFVLSLIMMSGATFAIGLLPTYSAAGLPATIAFVALRLVQGFSLGGELPGAITYVVEIAPKRRATFACGVVFACVTSGVLIATATSGALHALLTADQMQAYGWRIAFLFGGALGVVGWWLRRALHESPEFERMKRRPTADTQTGPLADLLKNHGKRIVVAIGATCVVATFNGLLFAHMPAYLGRALGYPGPEIALAMNVASAAMALSLVAAAFIADLVPRRAIFRAGCIVIAIGAFPAYQAMVGHQSPLWIVFLAIGLASALTHGTFAAILADLFPTRVRFSGVALSLNLGSVVFSGLAPAIATWLIEMTGHADAPAILMTGSALLALATSLALGPFEGRIFDEGETNSFTATAGKTV